jgi:cytochrome c-type biogenesis protein CcmI
MLWLNLVVMTCLAALAASWPLLRPKLRCESSDAAFYQVQLAEIEGDVEQGQLPVTKAGAARAEAAHRLVAVGEGGGPRIVDRLRRAAAIVVLMPVVVANAVLGRP